jgi:hypothetical protein
MCTIAGDLAVTTSISTRICTIAIATSSGMSTIGRLIAGTLGRAVFRVVITISIGKDR